MAQIKEAEQHQQDLIDQDAIEKIQELAKDQICLFCTQKDGKIITRPMSTRGIDDDGTIWFFSRADSHKNEEINREDTVTLMYLDSGKNHYLSLTGHAEILKDEAKTDELWSPFIKAWFEEGKEDPQLTLIRVTPEEGYYWDTKNGKLVSMLKIAAAVITGKKGLDGSLEGKLEL